MNIRSLFNEKIADLKDPILNFPWENKDAYASWMAQTYYFARETTRLLNFCGSLLDHHHESLHNRFIDHSVEEQGHPELLIKDLKHLDLNIDAFEEFNVTKAFYQSQYYWIQFKSPLAFFGYILLLEGIAAEYGTEMFERSKAAHGRMSSIFIQVHSTEDKDHTEKALQEVEAFPKSAQPMIMENFNESSYFYQKILNESQSFSLEKDYEMAS